MKWGIIFFLSYIPPPTSICGAWIIICAISKRNHNQPIWFWEIDFSIYISYISQCVGYPLYVRWHVCRRGVCINRIRLLAGRVECVIECSRRWRVRWMERGVCVCASKIHLPLRDVVQLWKLIPIEIWHHYPPKWISFFFFFAVGWIEWRGFLCERREQEKINNFYPMKKSISLFGGGLFDGYEANTYAQMYACRKYGNDFWNKLVNLFFLLVLSAPNSLPLCRSFLSSFLFLYWTNSIPSIWYK